MEFLVNNQKVFSLDTGEKLDFKKDTLILIHGSGQSHIVWSLTSQYMSDQNYNVITLDLPGHGNSEGESLKTIEDMVEWLEKVRDKLRIKDFYIAGHSQGCLVALEYVNRYPTNVKKIIFIAGAYEIPVNKSLIDLALSGNMESLNLMMKWGYEVQTIYRWHPLRTNWLKRKPREVLAVDLIACNKYKMTYVVKTQLSHYLFLENSDKNDSIRKRKKSLVW